MIVILHVCLFFILEYIECMHQSYSNLLSLIYIRCSMIVFFNFLLQLSSGKNKAYLEVLSCAINKCKCNTINQNMLFVISKIDRIAQR